MVLGNKSVVHQNVNHDVVDLDLGVQVGKDFEVQI